MFRTVTLFSVCLKCWTTIAFGLRSSTFTVGVIAEVPGNSRQNSQNFWLLGNNYTSLVNIVPVVSNVRWWDTLEVTRAICYLLDEDVDILLSFAPSEVDPILFSYARSFKLPLITSSFPPKSVSSKFDTDVNLIPNSNEAVADILKYYKWKTFLFFYDNDNGPERLQDILRLTNYMMDVEAMWKVSNEEECRRLLNYAENRASLRKNGTINALFATQEQLLDDVIKNIDHSEDSATKHHFILAEPSLGDLQRSFFQRALVTKFALVDKQTSVFQSFLKTWTVLQPLYDYQSETQLHHLTEMALLTLDAVRLMSISLTQAVQGSALDTRENGTKGQMSCNTNNRDDSIVPSVNGMAITKFMRTASFEKGVTGNIQFNTQGERKNFSLGVIERSPTPKKFAEWSDAYGLKVYPNRKKLEDFQDDSARKSKEKTQNGKHLVVTTVLTTPFLMMKNDKELSGNDRFYGFVKDLLDQLSSSLKFSYQIQLVKDNRFGKIINGEWNGMIGEVVREEADIAVAPLTITRSREEVVDFTIPFMTFGLNILMKKSASTLPDKNSRVLLTSFGFFKAFAYDVWLILVALFIIMSAGLFAVSKFTGFPDRIRSMDTKGSDRLTLCSSVWFAVGSLFLQNTAIYPRSFSHRVMSIVWWAFSLLIVIVYICSLSSLLVTERTINHGIIDPNIGSLQFLQRAMEKGSPTIGALASGSTAELFLKSEIGVFKDYGIFFKNNVNVSVNSYSEGARRVRSSNGSYALIMESLVSEYVSNLLPCDTVVTSGHLDNRAYSIAVKKGSFLKEYLDESLLELMEFGILRQIYEKWWHSEAECNDYSLHALPEIYSSSLNLNEVSGVFYLLIIGSVAACIAAVVEYVVRSKKISVDK